MECSLFSGGGEVRTRRDLPVRLLCFDFEKRWWWWWEIEDETV